MTASTITAERIGRIDFATELIALLIARKG